MSPVDSRQGVKYTTPCSRRGLSVLSQVTGEIGGTEIAMKQFAVIGLGRFGLSVAKTLSRLGHQVLAVDNDQDKVQHVANLVTHAVQADATDEEALRALGIRNVDVAVVSIGEKMESSILATLILKDLGVKHVVAKAHDELHGKVLERVGADRVIYPERDMAVRVATSLVSGNILDFIELSPEYSIVEAACPPEFAGKTLRELNIRARFGLNVVAIRSPQGRIRVSPGADDKVGEGDILVLIGRTENFDKLPKTE
ncbi:MAG TPA: TrkA family potassium uptake protein [Firmicutes bacterium]|nr:TrkA family potassium uptake protein [Bacillota bacterium]